VQNFFKPARNHLVAKDSSPRLSKTHVTTKPSLTSQASLGVHETSVKYKTSYPLDVIAGHAICAFRTRNTFLNVLCKDGDNLLRFNRTTEINCKHFQWVLVSIPADYVQVYFNNESYVVWLTWQFAKQHSPHVNKPFCRSGPFISKWEVLYRLSRVAESIQYHRPHKLRESHRLAAQNSNSHLTINTKAKYKHFRSRHSNMVLLYFVKQIQQNSGWECSDVGQVKRSRGPVQQSWVIRKATINQIPINSATCTLFVSEFVIFYNNST